MVHLHTNKFQLIDISKIFLEAKIILNREI